MCSGKTTVGKLLAEKLGWEFIDIDGEIESKEGLSIPDIFKSKGEDYFRNLEFEVLKGVSRRERVVVSTGGGLGANPEAMELMKERGLVVWLKVSYEEFLKRCAGSKDRPLLELGEEKLRKLLKEREKVYSEAHLKLEGRDPRSIAGAVVNYIHQSA